MPFDIIRLLKEADEAGQLENARKWQLIDLSIVETKLENFHSSKEMMDYLGEAYPSLFLFILEHFNMTN